MMVSKTAISPRCDTGCKTATDYLGHQSECLECPFAECVEDSKPNYHPRKNNG